MKIGISQPEHIPYIGFWNKLINSDIFILLDTVQFEKNNFQNRNRIRTKNGWDWMTVPVEKHNHKSIKDVKINYQNNWKEDYYNKIWENYHTSPYFFEIQIKYH